MKDVGFFLEAARLAREQRPDLRAWIVGDGPLRAEHERGAPEWVEFRGQVSDLPILLADTGVVALSSKSEGSTRRTHRGPSLRAPVVAVPVGGVDDVLHGRPGAIITAARTPALLADAIVASLNDGQQAEGAASGRDDIIECYGIDRLLRDIANLYDELWERSARRRT